MLSPGRKGQGRKAFHGGEVLVFPVLSPVRHSGPSLVTTCTRCKFLDHCVQLFVTVSLFHLPRNFPSFSSSCLKSRVGAYERVESKWEKPQRTFRGDENILNLDWHDYTGIYIIKAHEMKCLNSVHFTVYKPQQQQKSVCGLWAACVACEPRYRCLYAKTRVLLEWIRLGSVSFLENQRNWRRAPLHQALLYLQTSEAREDLCIERMNI